MIKPIDEENVGLKTSSSKLALFIGSALLAVIGGTIVMNRLNVNPFSPSSKPSNTLTSTSKSSKSTAQKAPEIQEVFTEKASEVIDSFQGAVLGVGEEVKKVGEDVGSQIMGQTIKFVENKASESANTVASSAASFVIKNTVGGVVEQINKLPPPQREEVKNLLCK